MGSGDRTFPAPQARTSGEKAIRHCAPSWKREHDLSEQTIYIHQDVVSALLKN